MTRKEKKSALRNLKNDSQEIDSLRLDLTEAERNAIHCLFESEKDRRNGWEWTEKEKCQIQNALDTLTEIGILDKFPHLKDFEPVLEDFDQFKFYKCATSYEGGYLPTSKAVDFLDLTYEEMVDQDKVMAFLQIPLNVLNVTECFEILPHGTLRVHLKEGFQYQGSSFIDTRAGEYQAFDIEEENQQIEQLGLFDSEEKILKKGEENTIPEETKEKIEELTDSINDILSEIKDDFPFSPPTTDDLRGCQNLLEYYGEALLNLSAEIEEILIKIEDYQGGAISAA